MSHFLENSQVNFFTSSEVNCEGNQYGPPDLINVTRHLQSLNCRIVQLSMSKKHTSFSLPCKLSNSKKSSSKSSYTYTFLSQEVIFSISSPSTKKSLNSAKNFPKNFKSFNSRMQLCTSLNCISATTIFSFLFLYSLSSTSPPPPPPPDPKLFTRPTTYLPNPNPDPDPDPPAPPSIAYFVSGSSGDLGRILRLLFAIYHPKNLYLLHLDRFAPQSDRRKLALEVQAVPVFGAARNVHVVGKPDFAYVGGSSAISAVLRGASVLLRLSDSWDWFVNLSVEDYPLVTQDDLLHIFSFLPKELNFVNHTSYIGWRESRKLRRIIVDPGLYQTDKTGMFYATGKRDMPSAYQLFSGSQMAILNRKFIEFCIFSSDNLPRKLLMYLANTPSSLMNYFSTILCNSPEFSKTVINHNLQYASFSNKSLEEGPMPLNATDLTEMIRSGSVFATEFLPDDPTLDFIDREVLGRSPGKVVPGGWCLGPANDTCAEWGHADILRPGPGAKRLENRLVELLSNGKFRSRQCVVE